MRATTGDTGHRWVATWAAMPQQTEDGNLPPPPFNQSDVCFRDTTLRQTLRVTAGGQRIRIRVSNAFGSTNLLVTAVTIALSKPGQDIRMGGSKVILVESLQAIYFSGRSRIEIPPGAFMVSDPVPFTVQAGAVITVSMYLHDGQIGHITSHPGSRTESWLCHGNHVASEDLSGPNLNSVLHWYFISGVEALQQVSQSQGTIVLLGDSLTDGRCSTDNGNNRWPDLLFDRMQIHPYAQKVSVLNQSAGGNRVLTDGIGPSLLSRLDRDLFGQVGVRYIFIFEGVNDIGTALPDAKAQKNVGERLIQAYEQIIERGHTAGLLVCASTIGPFGKAHGFYAHPVREETRQRVNSWIRDNAKFDAVIDFDAILRDANNPSYLKAEYDSGDGLHPNVGAFSAMANAFPLSLFS